MEGKIRLAVFGQKRLSREGGIEIVVKELCTRMAQNLLQHSRRSAGRLNVLYSDEVKKASVKLDEIVIYWERVAPYAALIITHLSVVSSRQRSYDRLRCEGITMRDRR